MKHIIKLSICFLVIFSLLFLPLSSVNAVHVNGYYRSNGTYVHSYERTAPDGIPYNNYSYPGNYNPNTGTITGGNADTYLDNYYSTGSRTNYFSTYSYPTNPTCPTNSYYDGISSCKCFYGYVVSGSSCISGNSLCHRQLGYNSMYNGLTNKCECTYGYVYDGSQCVSQISYCNKVAGPMSRYNSLSNTCECLSGYVFNGSTCVYKTPTTYTYNCGANSHISSTDITKCMCDNGFQINETKDACILMPTHKINDQACINTYGVNSNWDGTMSNDGKLLNCGCDFGYVWNSTRTACIINAKFSIPGCTSTIGFSTTTGQSCATGVFYPAGCTSFFGFSTTTGRSCGVK